MGVNCGILQNWATKQTSHYFLPTQNVGCMSMHKGSSPRACGLWQWSFSGDDHLRTTPSRQHVSFTPIFDTQLAKCGSSSELSSTPPHVAEHGRPTKVSEFRRLQLRLGLQVSRNSDKINVSALKNTIFGKFEDGLTKSRIRKV